MTASPLPPPPNTNGGKVAAAKPPDEWEGRKNTILIRQAAKAPNPFPFGKGEGEGMGNGAANSLLQRGRQVRQRRGRFFSLVPLKRNGKQETAQARPPPREYSRGGGCVLCSLPRRSAGNFCVAAFGKLRLPFYRRLAGRLAFGDFDCLHRSTRTFAAFTKRLLIQPLPIKPFDAPILSYSITLCVH